MTQSHHFGIIAATGYLSTSRQKLRILPSVSFQTNIFLKKKNTTSYFYRAQAVVATLCMSPHCLVSLPPDHPLLGLHLCSLHTSCDVTAVLPSLVHVYTCVTLENSFYDRFLHLLLPVSTESVCPASILLPQIHWYSYFINLNKFEQGIVDLEHFRTHLCLDLNILPPRDGGGWYGGRGRRVIENLSVCVCVRVFTIQKGESTAAIWESRSDID